MVTYRSIFFCVKVISSTLVLTRQLNSEYEYDYEYEIRQVKRVLYAYAIPYWREKVDVAVAHQYEIVEKSRSPHDDFSKKQRKLAFFCFPKIICSIYIAFIRRK
jgi:hypothetical protein